MLSRWGAGPALPSAVADVRGACTMPGQHSKGGHGYGGRDEPASQCEHESFGLTTLLSRVGSGAGSMPSSLSAAALGRQVPTPCFGSTVEVALVEKIWMKQPQRHECKSTGPTTLQL